MNDITEENKCKILLGEDINLNSGPKMKVNYAGYEDMYRHVAIAARSFNLFKNTLHPVYIDVYVRKPTFVSCKVELIFTENSQIINEDEDLRIHFSKEEIEEIYQYINWVFSSNFKEKIEAISLFA